MPEKPIREQIISMTRRGMSPPAVAATLRLALWQVRAELIQAELAGVVRQVNVNEWAVVEDRDE